MAFTKKEHPLQWGDVELKYLISVGLNPTNLYRAMGYKADRPTASFMNRIYRLGYTKPEPGRKGSV